MIRFKLYNKLRTFSYFRLEFYDQNANFGHAEADVVEPTIVLPPQESYRDINSDTKLPPINRTQIKHYLCL